jgi:sugar diacid utilization regulator
VQPGGAPPAGGDPGRWLRHGGGPSCGGADLHIHPQTVRYRLKQLRELFAPS